MGFGGRHPANGLNRKATVAQFHPLLMRDHQEHGGRCRRFFPCNFYGTIRGLVQAAEELFLGGRLSEQRAEITVRLDHQRLPLLEHPPAPCAAQSHAGTAGRSQPYGWAEIVAAHRTLAGARPSPYPRGCWKAGQDPPSRPSPEQVRSGGRHDARQCRLNRGLPMLSKPKTAAAPYAHAT